MQLTGIFREILDLSLMGTVLIMLLLGMKLFLRNRLSAKWHYMIWFLVILRLALPITVEHELSLYNLLKPVMSKIEITETHMWSSPTKHDTIPVPEGNDPIPSIKNGADKSQNPGTDNSLEGEKKLQMMDILALVWLLGAGIMAALTLLFNIRFYRKMVYSVPCQDPLSLKVLSDCYKLAAIHRPVPLFLNESAKIPLLFGVTRPRLIFSGQVLSRITQEEKRYIFLHELIHFKRRDILVNWLVALLRCLYWYNPLIHYAFYKMREDCEISCDESVLKLLTPSEYSDYGKTIISLLEMLSQPYALPCTSAFIQTKSCVRRRIYMISGFKQKTAIGTLVALCLTLLVGCSALTNAKTDSVKDFIEPTPIPTSTLTIADQSSDSSTDEAISQYTPAEQLLKEQAERSEEVIRQKQMEQVLEEKAKMEAEIRKLEQEQVNEEQAERLEEELRKLIRAEQLLEEEAKEIGLLIKKMTNERSAVNIYLEKLKDQSFTGTYGDGYTWYTAAEELGMLGKPAIPGLIEKLESKDDYERSLALYALLLASQHDNVKTFTNGEHIDVNLDFNPDSHPEMIEKAKAWWDKYKDNF